MSIPSILPSGQLHPDLVNNAAFVKQVDFDPVHQTTKTSQPAEKIHGDALPRFDKVSISAEGVAFQALKLARLGCADGEDTLSLDAVGESIEGKEWLKDAPNGDGSSVVLDITDHTALETSQHRNELYSRLMKSWNSLMGQLKQESESGDFDYFKTIRLFRSRSAEWERDLQQTDPEAYRVWLDKFKNVAHSQNES